MEKNEQFEDWLEVREKCMIGLEGYCAINIYVIEHFNQLPPAFQWGVYLEFFDSVEIDLDELFEAEKFDAYNIEQCDKLPREPIQTEAIKKAFEILNSK